MNTRECTPSEALQALQAAYDKRLSILMTGRPGVGKSDIVAAFAASIDAELIDVRLGTKTAADIGGLPALDHDTKTTTFYPPDFFPREDDGRPKVLFFDEIGQADDQTQGAVLGVILERRFGVHRLPDNVFIVAATNRFEDGVAPLRAPLNDRFVHLFVEASTEDWLKWAAANGVHRAVMAYIKTRPEALVPRQEELDQDFTILPSPRSWKRVSDILQSNHTPRPIQELLVSGLIGQASAAQFYLVADELVQMAEIDRLLEYAGDAKALGKLIPPSVNALWALAYSLAGVFTRANADHVLRLCGSLGELARAKTYAGLPVSDIQTLAFILVTERALAASPRIDINAQPDWKRWNAALDAEQRVA